MTRETFKLALVASVLSVATVLACTPAGKPDVRTAVDIAQVLCPDFSCVETLLADPHVTPEAKAQLRAMRAGAGGSAGGH